MTTQDNFPAEPTAGNMRGTQAGALDAGSSECSRRTWLMGAGTLAATAGAAHLLWDEMEQFQRAETVVARDALRSFAGRYYPRRLTGTRDRRQTDSQPGGAVETEPGRTNLRGATRQYQPGRGAGGRRSVPRLGCRRSAGRRGPGTCARRLAGLGTVGDGTHAEGVVTGIRRLEPRRRRRGQETRWAGRRSSPSICLAPWSERTMLFRYPK